MPGSPFRSDRAPSICGRVMSPPSSRTLSTYSSLCCTGGRDAWGAQFTAKPLNFQRQEIDLDAGLSLAAQHHSTVTLLARFRGLSTSRPSSTAR